MILLEDSLYKVTYDGKTYFCNRATTVIKATQETPVSVEKWKVNCAVDAVVELINGNTGWLLDHKQLRKYGWAAHEKETDYACAIGTEVHHNIDQEWISAEEFTCADSKQAYEGFKKWVTDFDVMPLAQEFSVFNIELACAGTIDLLCVIDGVLHLIDFKTATAIRESHLVQISLYKYMFEKLINDSHLGLVSDPRLIKAIKQVLQNTRSKKPKLKVGILLLKKDSSKKYRIPYVFKTLTDSEIKFYTNTAIYKCQLYKHLTNGGK